MMTQTLALMVDAYRELCAKKLFWITMLLSGLVVAAFAMVGINQTGLTFLWFQLPGDVFGPTLNSETLPPGLLYRTMFASLAVPIWLSWVAVILGLVSTAGMIPDLIQSGTIEAVLSRPIGRVRLLLTKFVGGLLFMALQVGVFTGLAFLVIGFRGGSWAWEIFLAIPVVVAMFSYLFAICVLLGLLTRSTIAALLLTILVWMIVFIFNTGDAIAVSAHEQVKANQRLEQARLERMERNATLAILNDLNEQRATDGLEPLESYEPTDEELTTRDIRIEPKRAQIEEIESGERLAETWRRGIYIGKTVLPKTQETIGLLERWTVDREALRQLGGPGPEDEDARASRDAQEAAADAIGNRPLWWVLGTSFLFEAIVLGLAALIFKRRDF
ncbi:MAG: ABC transporter permease subunit [Phycisphaerales bacterium]|jgi:ABC-type transport system involved in multi-copper enzyme maturation permease subunit